MFILIYMNICISMLYLYVQDASLPKAPAAKPAIKEAEAVQAGKLDALKGAAPGIAVKGAAPGIAVRPNPLADPTPLPQVQRSVFIV